MKSTIITAFIAVFFTGCSSVTSMKKEHSGEKKAMRKVHREEVSAVRTQHKQVISEIRDNQKVEIKAVTDENIKELKKLKQVQSVEFGGLMIKKGKALKELIR